MLKRYAVRLTPQARDDIVNIAAYIGEQSEDDYIGDLWEASLNEQLQRLDCFPNSYPLFSIRPYRKMIHGRYVIVFRVNEELREVLICRVFHGARLVRSVGPLEA
jgi:plasmid stabilization system protein ParE